MLPPFPFLDSSTRRPSSIAGFPPNTLPSSYITIKNLLLWLQPSSMSSFPFFSFHKI
jgi:hypothetical protein